MGGNSIEFCRGILALAAVLRLTCACAAAEPGANSIEASNEDPFESVNRTLFDINQFADRNVMKPVAQAYRDDLPQVVQHHIHDFLTNLGEPTIALNDVLQGNPWRFCTTVGRFLFNTTLGAIGVFDVATDWSMPHHDADFGQTLGVWGIEQGPYVMLPFFGPSGVRDAVGTVLGLAADPFIYVSGVPALDFVDAALGAGDAVDKRVSALDMLDALELTSVDYYATLRSSYLQYREAFVTEGKRPPAPSSNKGDIEMRQREQPLPSDVPTPSDE